jgi:phosphoserine phosphatase
VRWRLACFDLDGTLVQATSVSQHLADRFGQSLEMAELERRYAAGDIFNSVVAEEQAAMYGGMPVAQVVEALDDIPCIEGIDATVDALRKQGVDSLLCTVTWSFAAEEFCRRHGFVKGSGTEIDLETGDTLTGRVRRHFDEWDKLEFVRSYCAEAGVELEDCIAIGDSRSDVPLFEAVGFSIAINATEQAREVASVALDTGNLTDVLALIH